MLWVSMHTSESPAYQVLWCVESETRSGSGSRGGYLHQKPKRKESPINHKGPAQHGTSTTGTGASVQFGEHRDSSERAVWRACAACRADECEEKIEIKFFRCKSDQQPIETSRQQIPLKLQDLGFPQSFANSYKLSRSETEDTQCSKGVFRRDNHVRTIFYHDRSSTCTISQYENAGLASHLENTMSTINTTVTQKCKKYIQLLPAQPSIVFDLFFELSSFAHHNWPCVVRSRVELSPAAAYELKMKSGEPHCPTARFLLIKMSCYLYKTPLVN